MFRIAFLEMKNNKNYKKIRLALFICIFLMMLVVSLNLIIRNLTSNILANEYAMLSARTLTYDEPKNYNFDYDFISDVREYRIYSGNSYKDMITIDGKEMNYTSLSYCIGIDIEKDILSYNERIQFESITNNKLIKYGREIQNENELLITEGLVNKLGLNAKDVINKQISIRQDVNLGAIFSNDTWLEGFTICGVLDKKVKDVSPIGSEFIMIPNSYENDYAYSNYITNVWFKDYHDMDNRMNLINSKYNNEFYGDYTFIEFYVEKIEGYSEYILLIFNIFTIMLVFGIVTYILSMLIMNYNKSKINNFILYSYGLKNKKLLDILILTLINAIAFVISFVTILLLIIVLKKVIIHFMDVNIIVYWPIILCNLLVFVLFEVILIISNFVYNRINKNNLC